MFSGSFDDYFVYSHNSQCVILLHFARFGKTHYNRVVEHFEHQSQAPKTGTERLNMHVLEMDKFIENKYGNPKPMQTVDLKEAQSDAVSYVLSESYSLGLTPFQTDDPGELQMAEESIAKIKQGLKEAKTGNWSGIRSYLLENARLSKTAATQVANNQEENQGIPEGDETRADALTKLANIISPVPIEALSLN